MNKRNTKYRDWNRNL